MVAFDHDDYMYVIWHNDMGIYLNICVMRVEAAQLRFRNRANLRETHLTADDLTKQRRLQVGADGDEIPPRAR